MHELQMKVAGMLLKVIFGKSVCIEVYGKWIGTITPILQFKSVHTNIRSCMQDVSKTSFPLQERIFVYSWVFVQ